MKFRKRKTIDEGIIYKSEEAITKTYVYEPGNATRYEIVIVKMLESNGSDMYLSWPQDSLLICIVNFNKSIIIQDKTYISPSYLKEKIEMSDSSCAVLAEFIAHVTKCKAPSAY